MVVGLIVLRKIVSNMKVIKYKKIFIFISFALVSTSLAVIFIKGLDYSIDFTGGSLMEVSYEERPPIDTVRTQLLSLGFDEAQIQPFGEESYLVTTDLASEEERSALIGAVSDESLENAGTIERFTSIGPSVGKELRKKSLYSLLLVSLGIIFFVAYAFRKVSQPVSSWKYGIAAVLALLHDIIIPVGILTLIGTEIDPLYVVGLLSILGLSVNDTIVVFDRLRENLQHNEEKHIAEPFDTTVGHAILQTMNRSLFTSLTLIVVLIALYILGPVATRTLSLVLLLGMVIGTYSSIFLASPLLTMMVSKNKDR